MLWQCWFCAKRRRTVNALHRLLGLVCRFCFLVGNGRPRQNVSLVHIHLGKLLWVYCPGRAGVKGNDRAERLAGKATIKSGLLLGRSEVLRNLRTTCGVQSQGLHTIDRLEERSVERGSAGRCSLKGRERAIVNQTNIGTVPKATLGGISSETGCSAYGLFLSEIPIIGAYRRTKYLSQWSTEGRICSYSLQQNEILVIRAHKGTQFLSQ